MLVRVQQGANMCSGTEEEEAAVLRRGKTALTFMNLLGDVSKSKNGLIIYLKHCSGLFRYVKDSL